MLKKKDQTNALDIHLAHVKYFVEKEVALRHVNVIFLGPQPIELSLRDHDIGWDPIFFSF